MTQIYRCVTENFSLLVLLTQLMTPTGKGFGPLAVHRRHRRKKIKARVQAQSEKNEIILEELLRLLIINTLKR